MKNAKPLYLYILFVSCILLSRFFENRIEPVYYLFVAAGWFFFFYAVRNYFKNRKGGRKPVKRSRK